MKNKLILLLIVFCFAANAQDTSFHSQDIEISPLVEGTLLLPDATEAIPLVIFIAGSGPTDRNGNQVLLKNNSLQFLAEALYPQHIATFRYDKRIFKQMKLGTLKEEDIDFDDFIQDATDVLTFFKDDKRFSSIIIAGHSQGSLVGMVAAQQGADGFISLAGAGQEIDDVIIDQLAKQSPHLVPDARKAFDDLRVYGFITQYNQALTSLIRPSIEYFMYSWMQYNPQTELKKLSIPVLIINGDRDFQIQISEAEKLKEAQPKATLVIIPNMNHIFKEVVTDSLLENQQTYSNPDLPVVKLLIEEVSKFVKNIKS